MNYADLVRIGLKKHKISISKAAEWLNISRPSLYSRLETGNFLINEINILTAKGVLTAEKLFTIEQIADYLLTRKDLDDAIMSLDDMHEILTTK